MSWFNTLHWKNTSAITHSTLYKKTKKEAPKTGRFKHGIILLKWCARQRKLCKVRLVMWVVWMAGEIGWKWGPVYTRSSPHCQSLQHDVTNLPSVRFGEDELDPSLMGNGVTSSVPLSTQTTIFFFSSVQRADFQLAPCMWRHARRLGRW